MGVDDGARGLQVLYGRDTLARMDAESRQLARDPKAKTPTVWAIGKLDSSEIVPMTSAASALSRSLDEDRFKAEQADTWGGRPARLLTFSIPVDKLPPQQRKYVKEFDGTPLASQAHVVVKGRAFVVIGFDAVDDWNTTYAVLGDRLLALRAENRSTSNGAGEHGEQRVVKTLQPQG